MTAKTSDEEKLREIMGYGKHDDLFKIIMDWHRSQLVELQSKWHKAGYDDGIAFERKKRAEWAKMLVDEVWEDLEKNNDVTTFNIPYARGWSDFGIEIRKRIEEDKCTNQK